MTRIVSRIALVCGVFASTGVAQSPVYKNPRAPIEARVRDLLGRMTIEEKFFQLWMVPGAIGDSGTDYSKGIFGLQWRGAKNSEDDAAAANRMQRYLRDSTRLGIPMLPFEEAVHGLMRREAPVFPAAIGLAASFDTALMGNVAANMAAEARDRGIRQVLSPVINIATDVRWGRVQETYGEDPFLSAAMGRAFVRAFETRGVIATPKHFVANVGDGGRDSYPIDLSKRQLEELHFPPFKSAIKDAGARSVMVSYNSVDGLPASQNPGLMRSTLKGDWGFGGFVISDQAGVGGSTVLHHTEASTATAAKRAVEGGLDVIFQSSWSQYRPWLAAFQNAGIDRDAIDSAVARVLKAKFQLGLFEDPFSSYGRRVRDDEALQKLASASAIVLLKNTNVLPLGNPRRVAVIGVDADEARLGDYTLDDAKGGSILSAVRAKLGADRVTYAPGPGRSSTSLVVVPSSAFDSLRGEYWPNNRFDGAPTITRRDANLDARWTLSSPGRGIPVDWYSVRWTGRVVAPTTGVRRLAIEGNDGNRLWIDGKLAIDNARKESYRTTTIDVGWQPGSVHEIRLDYTESTGNARLKLLWDGGVSDSSDHRMNEALLAARGADASIVVAGIEEGEFRDRSHLGLPGRQEELITRIAQVSSGKPVIVVLIGGSAITMPWIDRADAVVDAWYPGQKGGQAVVDVLFGDANPAGRLPITFPLSEGQLPLVYNHKPTGRGDDYVDGTGMALFPFGFGLSYTTFEYSALKITPDTADAAERIVVSFRVKNTGTRAGDEVPQLYVKDLLASVARPVIELKGFTRIKLAAGEEREVQLSFSGDDLKFLDDQMRWVTELGTYRILVGASSKDIRLRGDLVLTRRTPRR